MTSPPAPFCRGRHTDIEGLVYNDRAEAWYSTGSAFCTEPTRCDAPRAWPTRCKAPRAWITPRLRYRLPAIGASIALFFLATTLLMSFGGTPTPAVSEVDGFARESIEKQILLKLSNSHEKCVAQLQPQSVLVTSALKLIIGVVTTDSTGATAGMVLWEPLISQQYELQAVWLASTVLCDGGSGTVHMNRIVEITYNRFPDAGSSELYRSVLQVQDELAYCIQNLLWKKETTSLIECDLHK
jgi:hypothetical protein